MMCELQAEAHGAGGWAQYSLSQAPEDGPANPWPVLLVIMAVLVLLPGGREE